MRGEQSLVCVCILTVKVTRGYTQRETTQGRELPGGDWA